MYKGGGGFGADFASGDFIVHIFFVLRGAHAPPQRQICVNVQLQNRLQEAQTEQFENRASNPKKGNQTKARPHPTSYRGVSASFSFCGWWLAHTPCASRLADALNRFTRPISRWMVRRRRHDPKSSRSHRTGSSIGRDRFGACGLVGFLPLNRRRLN